MITDDRSSARPSGSGIGGLAASAPATVEAQSEQHPAMADDLTAEEVQWLLDLEPNATCGFVRVTFLSELAIAPGGLPAPLTNGRPLGSALYFLVTPHAPVRLHRIRNEQQLYHYYLGDPIEACLLHADSGAERVVVGLDLVVGQRPQLLIPGGTFHSARLIGRRRWFWGEHGMAGCGAGGRRDRRRRADGRRTPVRRCRSARHRRLGAARHASRRSPLGGFVA